MRRRFCIAMMIAVSMGAAAQAQEVLPPEIVSAYHASLSAMQSARSSQDISRMVEAMDAPDWVSISPGGEKIFRGQAEEQLMGLLAVPTGQRPTPLQRIIYVHQSGVHTLVVYWVYRNTSQGPVGSVVRDTWTNTHLGWRRSLHEKFFPDRPLAMS